MKTFVIELDKNATVCGVEVVKGEYREVAELVNIVPAPQPGGYQSGPEEAHSYLSDQKVYEMDRLFPGKLVDVEVGADSKRQYALVRFFPVQYQPSQKKAVVVTDATIELYYDYGNRLSDASSVVGATANASSAALPTTTSECIIISPALLLNEANLLNDFHNNTEKITSSVITTETIDTSGEIAPDPPFSGYSNNKNPGWSSITNYNYTLAKKIIAYLNATSHTNLKYVTLLGDALLVPPSYYYYQCSGNSAYENWLPTDFFYGSPDYDLLPNYSVGRIPVSTAAEASQVVNKIINWPGSVQSVQNDAWSWFQNTYVVGGIPHTGDYYCAELNTTEAINMDLFSGMNITKCYESDGRFNKSCVEPAFKNADAGIVFSISHGSGASLSLGGTYLSVNDLMSYPAHDKTPVIISVSCENGNYDLDLVPPPSNYKTSFGEAVLKSAAGGIGYIGAARNAFGDSLYHYENGNIVIYHLTYIIALQNYVMQSYHSGATTLGQLSLDALTSYFRGNTMTSDPNSDPNNVWTLLQHVLLGDPALRIPVQPPSIGSLKPQWTGSSPTPSLTGEHIPVFTSTPTISATANSPANSPIKWKLIDDNARVTLDPGTINTAGSYSSKPSTASRYFLRFSSQADNYAKENWFCYMFSQNPNNFLHVSNMTISTAAKAGQKWENALVTIVDNAGKPVPKVTVNGNWGGLTMIPAVGTTNTKGQVTLSSNKIDQNVAGNFTLCVGRVVLTNWNYDASANTSTCKSTQ